MKTLQVSQWLLSGEEHEPTATFLCWYTADWCGSCRRILPTVCRVMNGSSNLGTVDREVGDGAALVESIPLFIVQDGRRNVLGTLQTCSGQFFREFMRGFGVTETTGLRDKAVRVRFLVRPGPERRQRQGQDAGEEGGER